MLQFKRSHIDICLEHDSSASRVYSDLYYESILICDVLEWCVHSKGRSGRNCMQGMRMRTEHVDWRCLCCVCVSPHILRGVEMRRSENKPWPMGMCLRTGWLSLSNCLWLGTSKHLRILIRPSNVVKVVCPGRKWEHNSFNTILGLFFIYFLLWLKKTHP